MKFFVPVVTLLVSVFLFVSCKKIQPEMSDFNEECSCAEETSADFTIEELSIPIPSGFYTQTDTAFAEKNIRFTALQNNAEYTWYIGSEVLTDQSFSRYFDNTTADTDIPVSLVVRKTPNNVCFPNDTGYDSITKILSIVNRNEITNGTYNLEGTYRMIAPHLSDSIDISLDFHYGHPQFISGGRSVMVYNWDGQGAICEGNQGGGMSVPQINYREFVTEITTNCDGLQLNMVRNLNEEILLTVRYEEGFDIYYYNYKGRKL